MKLALIRPLTVLSIALSAPLYAANAATPFTADQKAQIQEVVHQYLLDKPEVIVEAVQTLQRKQYEQAQATVKETQQSVAKFAQPLFHGNNDPVAGNPQGKISVVEFFDYQCPHCVDMGPVIEKLIKSNSEVRVVYKDFPIRGPMSELAARVSLVANKQGKYFDFHHALMNLGQPLTEDNIFATAQKIGLNMTTLKQDVNDAAISNQLKADVKLAQDLKLFGTPAFFVGPTNATSTSTINYVPGQVSLEQMQGFIAKINQTN